MTQSEHPVTVALAAFIKDYLTLNPVLKIPRDPLWPSDCELTDAEDSVWVSWRPSTRHNAEDFIGLESALGCVVHEDIKAYYGSYWSDTLEAEAEEGHVSLLFLWNQADADRLTENLIGHVLQQRRQKMPLTWFFACTEPDSEYFLSVENDSGVVLLEKPGSRSVRQVADSLQAFLARLSPARHLTESSFVTAGEVAEN